MAKTLEEVLAATEQLADRLGKAVDTLETPSNAHFHSDGMGYSYIEADNGPVQIQKAHAGALGGGRRRTYPNGYKPYQFKKNFGEMLAMGLTDKDKFTNEYRAFHKSIQKAVAGMSEGVGADGGYTVLPEFSQKIFEKVYDNSLWDMTDNYTVQGNSMTFPRLNESSRADGSRAGGVRGYWVNEGATITSSKPALGQLMLKLKKLAVVVYLTDELIDDAGMALEAFVNRKVSEEFKFLLGNSIINGPGGGQPLGILNSPARVTVAKRTGQLAATIVTQNITDMWSRLWIGSRPNAVWLINQDTEAQLNTMTLGVGTGGVVTYMPPGGLSGSPYATLMGRPVIPVEFCSTLGTEGDIILCDMKQYVTLSKGGVAQAQSVHVEFLTDQTALRFIMRADGETWENSPVTPFKGTATQSSFITLATRS